MELFSAPGFCTLIETKENNNTNLASRKDHIQVQDSSL